MYYFTVKIAPYANLGFGSPPPQISSYNSKNIWNLLPIWKRVLMGVTAVTPGMPGVGCDSMGLRRSPSN